MELTPLQPIQVITFVVALGILIASLIWSFLEERRGTAAYVIGPIMFSVHIIIFYGVIIGRELGLYETGSLTIWSAYLRLHGLLTMLGLLLMIIYRCTRISRGR